jgi:Holliday junction resolvasome RuvABC endonuclease subunit
MHNYLALDISLNSTGFAVINEDKNLLNYGYIDYDKTITEKHKELVYHEKTNLQLEKIRILLREHSVSEVFLERFSFGSFGNSSAVSVLAEVTGAIKLYLYNRSIPYHAVSPQTVKKFITGNGRAKKEDVYDSIISLYPGVSGSRYDVTDAIGVGLTGMSVLGIS